MSLSTASEEILQKEGKVMDNLNSRFHSVMFWTFLIAIFRSNWMLGRLGMKLLCIITVQAAVWEKVAKSSHLGKASGPMMIENNNLSGHEKTVTRQWLN